jgi:hypothetical protein
MDLYKEYGKKACELTEREIYCNVGGLVAEMARLDQEGAFLDDFGHLFWVPVGPCEDECGDCEECEQHEEGETREVYEHWAVSPWLARKLAAVGESVEVDFFGVTVWARCTTGQHISLDWAMLTVCEGLES